MKSQFMWQDESSGGVQGAIIDHEAGMIQWLDQPGCACGDDAQWQSISEFLAKGAFYLAPPDDILAEMRAALHLEPS